LSAQITNEDKMMAANLASIAVRRCDSPAKAVVTLMLAATVVAFTERDEAKPMFHFVAVIKRLFESVADASFGHAIELKEDQKRPS